MSSSFLQIITEKARANAARSKCEIDLKALRQFAGDQRSASEPFRLHKALSSNGTNIIAEIKRASPSKGVINADIDVGTLAREYEAGGAAAISVLTEDQYFKGSLDDLQAVRSYVSLPILRKDFIVDEIQILEAAVAGADAILLIVTALSPDELGTLSGITRNLGMDALIEVHSTTEMSVAADIGATIVGINNRNLLTLDVSLDVSRDLISGRPHGVLMVAESGISSCSEIKELRQLGFNGFLVGETLMRNSDPRGTLKAWQ